MSKELNCAERSSFGMNKVIYLLLILFCILFSFFLGSCREKRDDRTVLTFVTWKPNQPEVWDELLETFHSENPDIRIEREVGPHSSTAFHDLLTQKLKNQSKDVDVFFMDVVWPPEFAAAGWAMELDEYFPSAERKKFLPGTILANEYRGRIYGVPVFIDSGMLFYRTDLLEEYGFHPPEIWSELVQQAITIVQEEGKKGRNIYGYSGQFKQYEGLVCNMLEFILGNNGYVLDIEKFDVGIDEAQAVEAVRFVRDSIVGNIAPKGVLAYQEPESLDLFVQGKTVFHRNWPYAWGVSSDPEKSLVAGKVGISVLPHFDGGQSFATLGGWQLGISSYSENKKAAWKFVQFLSSERVQKILALRAGKAPTRVELYDDADVLASNKHFSSMKRVFRSAYPRPRSPLYPSISNILQRYFSKAVSDQAIDIQHEAIEAKREIEKILDIVP